MKKVWKIYETNPRLREAIASELGVSPLLAQILVNRNIRTPEDAHFFLFGDLSSCHDPFLFKDMDKAVARIQKAVQGKEKILIYGDYDVDGITSIALLFFILCKMGACVETFIPNRLEEGYGLNLRAVELAREKGVSLLITVDCGINSLKEVEYANECGIDVIVTDHHEIREDILPSAFAIIDAHQKDCGYPFKGLAGVGVVYKLARALMGGSGKEAEQYLDLVALGTIADIAPLNGENRILVKAGLKELRKTKNTGLAALMEVAGIDPAGVNSRHVGFILGPRINAMGRVGAADTALELFLCGEEHKALDIAKILDRENRNRQAIEKDLLASAGELIRSEIDTDNERFIVLAQEGWHPGVLGIAASRIAEEWNLPVVLISIDGENGKGSGRSIEGFNLFEALKEAREHLIDFGGHESACGIRIRKEKIGDFTKAVGMVAKKYFLSGKELVPELKIDMNLPFAHVGMKLIKEMEMLTPYGPDNTEPVFSTNGIRVKNSPRTIGKSGFKFLATCGDLTCEAVTFNKKNVNKPGPGGMINLAYTPSINSWGGIETIQLNIRDLELLPK